MFLCSIAAANWAVTHMDPVPVWPGIYAPAAVPLIACTLVLRDLVQRFSGSVGLVCAFVGGIALSFVLADPAVVWASLAAFAVSFVIDTAVFTLAWREGRPLWAAALVSGLVSLVPDTFVFLWLAGLLEFAAGQLIGKAEMTLVYALILAVSYAGRERRRDEVVPA